MSDRQTRIVSQLVTVPGMSVLVLNKSYTSSVAQVLCHASGCYAPG